MKKGFTLMELLVVLAVLALVVLISIPQILGVLENSRENSRNRLYEFIISSARLYVGDNRLGESEPILISTLCSNNYLDCPIYDPVTDEEIDGYVFSYFDKEGTGSIVYEYFEGAPDPLAPILLSTVAGRDTSVNLYAGNGLYKHGDEYIFRGGITKTNPDGLTTSGFSNDSNSGSDVNNFVKVPWESYSVGENCTTTSNNCWRIVKLNSDGSIKIIRDRNAGDQVFDNTINTGARTINNNFTTVYGYNDLTKNTPTAGYPEEFREKSLVYESLYGENGYYKNDLIRYKNLFTPFNICLNKANDYKSLNNTGDLTRVTDTCDVIGKPDTQVVRPLRNKYVGLLQVEEYLNATTESTCTRSSQFQCRNQNFLYSGQSFWLANGRSSTSWQVRSIQNNGRAHYTTASSSIGFRPVVILKPTVIISGGNGTAESPYVIRG